MNKKTIMLSIFLFATIQNISLVDSQVCLSDVKIKLNMYEEEEIGDEVFLNKSIHQMNKPGEKFVREGDILLVENLNSRINASCLQDYSDKRRLTLQFRRPNSEEWGEDIDILLQITNSKIKTYSIDLKETNLSQNLRYEDSLGTKIAIPPYV